MSIQNQGHGAGERGFPHHLDPADKSPLAAMANQSTVEQTLAQRGKVYGDFSDHARLCQQIKDDMVNTRGSKWKRLCDVQKQALEVIADKIARILTGDPDYPDNWHDIQGYAKLAEERLPCNAGKPAIVGSSRPLSRSSDACPQTEKQDRRSSDYPWQDTRFTDHDAGRPL